MPNCIWCETRPIPQISWGTLFTVGQRPGFCEDCSSGLVRLIGCRVCKGCGRDLDTVEAAYQKEGLCRDCQVWQEREQKEEASLLFEGNRAVYVYNDFLKQVITRYKFRGDALLIEGFREELRTAYKKWYKKRIAIPIPLSDERRAERTFNQAGLIAHCLNAPVLEALVRLDQKGKQSKRSRRERLKKGENPFQGLLDLRTQIENQDVVLIDDIYTTGATLHFAAIALAPLGPRSISSFTLARG